MSEKLKVKNKWMFSLLTKEQKDKRFNNKVKTGCFYRFYFLTINF